MTEAAPGVTRALARRALAIRFSDLPGEVRALARQCILDSLGTALAGADDELVRILTAELAEQGGNPVCGVIGRSREILNSSVVCPKPLSRVDCTASPMQLSSRVAEKPPCTVPDGLRWWSPGCAVTTTRPCSASATS